MLKMEFFKELFDEFWLEIRIEFQTISEMVLKMQFSFTTLYKMLPAISIMHPTFDSSCKNKQARPAH